MHVSSVLMDLGLSGFREKGQRFEDVELTVYTIKGDRNGRKRMVVLSLRVDGHHTFALTLTGSFQYLRHWVRITLRPCCGESTASGVMTKC